MNTRSVPRCPKCDAGLWPESETCEECGTPVALAGFRPGVAKEGGPLFDPLLEVFEKDEAVRYCPDCQNEFDPDQKLCRRCNVSLLRQPRTAYDAALFRRPIHDLAAEVAPGPPTLPKDLVRMHVARSLEEADACLTDLRFMAVPAWAGSDALDPFPEISHVGIYVRAHDRDPAHYVLLGVKVEVDELAEAEPPKAAATRRIRRYLEFGKFREAVRLAETELAKTLEGKRFEAEALIRGARPREAERRLVHATESGEFSGHDQGRLLGNLALVRCLGNDGSAFGEGARPELAPSGFVAAQQLIPRLVDLAKAEVEVEVHLGRRERVLAALKSVERINANLLSRDGWFRALRESPDLLTGFW